MDKEFSHIPVMPKEVIQYLNPHQGGIYVDGTLGGGGHSKLIAQAMGKNGQLIGIDQDPEALNAAKINLSDFNSQTKLIRGNFRHLRALLGELNINKVDGILLDLGVSSYQLDTPERGFSFREQSDYLEARLDMRMDPSQPVSAYEVVNEYREDELADILYRLGEEPFARRIAKRIVQQRQKQPIESTNDLLQIIKSATPPSYRFSRKHGHYASKVFRAIRMEVNKELPAVEDVIPQAVSSLKPGGNLVIITFHSLEDRIVKHRFRELANQSPPAVTLLTKKAIKPTLEEISVNPRAESAKLRAVRKL